LPTLRADRCQPLGAKGERVEGGGRRDWLHDWLVRNRLAPRSRGTAKRGLTADWEVSAALATLSDRGGGTLPKIAIYGDHS
jgi:hypothetical protein